MKLIPLMTLFMGMSQALAAGIPANPAEHIPVMCVEDIVPADSRSSDARETLAATNDWNNETYEFAWIYLDAIKGSQEKIQRVYEAATQYGMPPTLLSGAIAQESGFMDMGLYSDFGNWACGNIQINVRDWCEWAQSSDAAVQHRINWPAQLIADFQLQNPGADICDSSFIVPEHARPYFEIGMKRLQKRLPQAPAYMLKDDDLFAPRTVEYGDIRDEFEKITKAYQTPAPASDSTDIVSPILPTKDEKKSQRLRFAMTRSFAEHCSNHNFGISAGAFTIAAIFQTLPQEIQDAQKYAPGEKESLVCATHANQPYYPLAVGWLLADAIYNAGPELLPGILDYQKQKGIAWNDFSPQVLIDAINYSLSLPNNGLSEIGATEAKAHITGVVAAVSPPADKSDDEN